MKKIIARTPIDKTAALVTSKGVSFKSTKKVQTADQKTPIKTKPFVGTDGRPNLTGRRFGRFTVIGVAKHLKGKWVVRCDCGVYTARSSKAITNPENAQDRCEECRHLAYLKRDNRWRSTGIDSDIRNF